LTLAPKINRLVETSLYVANLERSARFYTQVLGLEIESSFKGRHVFLIAGQSMLLLFDPKYLKREHEEEGEKAIPQIYELGRTHIAFEIDPKDYDGWKDKLRKSNAIVETEKTWEKGNRSIYFRDPDGNVVELIEPGSWPITPLRK
jgi:catechol 2,3-dioxygenase-like lactoylglutathione lyase family enzyme